MSRARGIRPTCTRRGTRRRFAQRRHDARRRPHRSNRARSGPHATRGSRIRRAARRPRSSSMASCRIRAQGTASPPSSRPARSACSPSTSPGTAAPAGAHATRRSAWANDVVETLEPLLDGPPDVVMGHSLGGLVASLVADRHGAACGHLHRPGLLVPDGHQGLGLQGLLRDRAAAQGGSALVRMNPKWSAVDVDIELATLRDWDKRTILGFGDSTPSRSVPPVRARRAERSSCSPRRASHHAKRRRGSCAARA